ncbi:MAG TPA: hypothetical protein ACFE0H_00980 [Elainellaceae cyanobacterium]
MRPFNYRSNRVSVRSHFYRIHGWCAGYLYTPPDSPAPTVL